jgi:hypothetical protein
MNRANEYWRGAANRVLKWLSYGALAGSIGMFTLGDATSFGQRGERGGRSRGGGGGGGGQVRTPSGGGGQARISGGGGGQVRIPSGGGAQVRVPSGGGQVRAPGGGAEVRLPTVVPPRAGGEVRAPSAGGQVRIPGAGGAIRTPGAGGEVRVPGGEGQVRIPGAGGEIRTPGAGGEVRVPGGEGQVRIPGAGGEIRTPGAEGRVRVPGADAEFRTRDGEARTALRPNLDADVRGGARIDGSATARVPGGVRIDPSVAGQANVRVAPSWANLSRDQRQQFDEFRTKFSSALGVSARADVRGDRFDGRNDWFDRHPDRHRHWSHWGHHARSTFRFGFDPFFTFGWWNSRPLIGIGLGGYGWDYGRGYGGWWGYQPWLGHYPWWHWYRHPGWVSLIGFGGWGWHRPYYYDYGPGGNVVYTGDHVYVNSVPVATSVEYAQTAAALATVDPATVEPTNPEDWMPLGTFTLATAQDESDPARVLQLAVNKNGLLSGTSFNKQTGKTYTVQGRVDKDTQRVAFTIGTATDIVLETGLFNLTQQETPVLAHLGANRTATYLLARLPEPEHEAEQAAPPPAPEPALP